MLSKKTKYAINALVYLARQNPDNLIPISQIAESEGISRKFLEAILLDLRNAGILNSRKGKTGGYYLLLPPEKINIADIMRIFDGPIALLPCVTYKYYQRCNECKNELVCGIRDVFFNVRNETVKLLKEATLALILQRTTELEEELLSKPVEDISPESTRD